MIDVEKSPIAVVSLMKSVTTKDQDKVRDLLIEGPHDADCLIALKGKINVGGTEMYCPFGELPPTVILEEIVDAFQGICQARQIDLAFERLVEGLRAAIIAKVIGQKKREIFEGNMQRVEEAQSRARALAGELPLRPRKGKITAKIDATLAS